MALKAARAPARARWTLSEQAFSALLSLLGPDRERAAERYEAIRRKLTRLFEWRGFADPEELADATFDRVARKVEEGMELTAADAYSYVHGVALRVAQERWRADARWHSAPEALADARAAADWPSSGERAQEQEQAEGRLRCLDECLEALDAPARALLRRYHGGGSRIEDRRELAREMGISATALRLRVFRLRGALHGCVRRCLGDAGAETEPPAEA
jgi:hypothetical protein